MSDPQPRTSANAPTRRTRRTNLRNAEDDKQREKKRALDRKAQRASREKTRSHIAHLENMVRILSEKNGGTTTGELLEEMARLHAEIDRLRKIIDGIKSVLGMNVFELTAPSSRLDDPSDSPDHEMKLSEATSSSEDQSNDKDGNMGDSDLKVYTHTVMEFGLVGKPLETTSNGVKELAWISPIWDGVKVPNFLHSSNWMLPNPVKTRLPTPPAPEFLQCKYWKKAISTYGKIFAYDKERRRAADTVDSGSLFKVVKHGWNSLTPQERDNPVLQILEEVDKNLFWDVDPVTKIANLYKSHLILKYFFNAERRNLDLIPTWQRPVHSQRICKHPLPIDFFPWPALRDRLVRRNNYYFATSDFSVHYRQNFRFNWPFGIDETYQYSPATRTYRISPLFERYFSDEKSWSMDKLFFQKFPEFNGEIPVRDFPLQDTRPNEIPSPRSPSDSLVPGVHELWARFSNRIAGSNDDFEDECMMALFDELPPT